MEDISRELEREIAKAKPTPYRTRKDEKILIVDEFGDMRSGGYLKALVRIFLFISLSGVVSAVGFYYLYTQVKKENSRLSNRLAVVEKRADRLAGDREILMARLVMAGKTVELSSAPEESEASPPAPPSSEDAETEPGEAVATSNGVQVANEPGANADKSESGSAGAGSQAGEDQKANGDRSQPKDTDEAVSPIVSIEKFSVARGSRGGELNVRFNIRNVSKTSKEVSGRIFAVLNSGKPFEAGGVVVPGGVVENGVPGPYRKGQYFSITRFKPVRFTVKSQAVPEKIKTATVYVFGDDERLIFKNTMAVNGSE